MANVLKWMAALKIWNGRDPAHPNGKADKPWCVPRKGTPEHAEVKEIMRTGKLPSAAAATPTPKRRFKLVPGEDANVVKVKKFLTKKVRGIKGKKEVAGEVEGAKCFKGRTEVAKKEGAYVKGLTEEQKNVYDEAKAYEKYAANPVIMERIPNDIRKKDVECQKLWVQSELFEAGKRGVAEDEEDRRRLPKPEPPAIKIKRKRREPEAPAALPESDVLTPQNEQNVQLMSEFLKLYEAEAPKEIESEYSALAFLQYIHWAYLIKKYKNNCYVLTYDKRQKIDDRYLSYTVGLDISTARSVKKPSEAMLEEIGEIIQKCIKDGVKLVVMPLGLPNHANLLIYRAKDNSFERFEPHGSAYRGRKGEALDDKVNDVVRKVVNALAKGKYIPANPIYRDAAEVCPNPKGFQSVENEQFREYFGKMTGGFCGMWSAFFAEMALKYPDITSAELYQKAMDELKNKGPRGFYNHIANYTKDVSAAIGRFLGEDFSFADFRRRTPAQQRKNTANIDKVYDWWKNYVRKIIKNNQGVEKIEGGCIRLVRHGKDCV